MRRVSIALAGAALWSAALVAAALTVPVYSGEESSFGADGSVVTRAPSDTLVDVNGPWAAILAAIPLAVTVVVAVLLTYRRHRVARVAAWGAVAALALLTVAGLLSVGFFFVPVVAALCLAVGSAPAPPRADPSLHAVAR